jgi:hypothetical protein
VVHFVAITVLNVTIVTCSGALFKLVDYAQMVAGVAAMSSLMETLILVPECGVKSIILSNDLSSCFIPKMTYPA